MSILCHHNTGYDNIDLLCGFGVNLADSDSRILKKMRFLGD